MVAGSVDQAGPAPQPRQAQGADVHPAEPETLRVEALRAKQLQAERARAEPRLRWVEGQDRCASRGARVRLLPRLWVTRLGSSLRELRALLQQLQ